MLIEVNPILRAIPILMLCGASLARADTGFSPPARQHLGTFSSRECKALLAVASHGDDPISINGKLSTSGGAHCMDGAKIDLVLEGSVTKSTPEGTVKSNLTRAACVDAAYTSFSPGGYKQMKINGVRVDHEPDILAACRLPRNTISWPECGKAYC
ncbi:hypothetical protein [Paraburkholderia sp. J8-2]|uniref:hypothetical protein n=1 Tax=Paraburkholderia sp. J8-2 TaxID=2805440 RepID=UPI002AB6F230|nr:hypothetical protein [Paraburkholderia sp. J8-2]